MKKLGTFLKNVLNDRKKLWLSVGLGIFVSLIAVALIAHFQVQAQQDQQLTTNDQSILESRGSDPEIDRIPVAQAKEEQSSARAAALLQNHGFERVNALLGGFEAWQSANFPVEPAAK
jgi:rhodanese-related sulfurtransferase